MNKLFWRLDSIGAELPKFTRIEDTIVISGTPRSGSTWFLEILRSLWYYKTVVEPLDPRNYPQVKKLGLQPRPYFSSEEERPEVYEYMSNL
ncbi:MAG: hypothetical protein ACTSPI_12420, partial [Candidatus Heimdallarchaeaceae archaeon]